MKTKMKLCHLIWPVLFSLFLGCKKETFDKRPDYSFKGDIIFSPEATGTSATNQSNLFFLTSADDFHMVKMGSDSAFGYISFETESGKYFNTNANSIQPVSYKFFLVTPPFSLPLSLGSYKYTPNGYRFPVINQTNAMLNSPGSTLTAHATGFNYNGTWFTAKSNSRTYFAFLPDSYIKINFTNVYKRKLEDGEHTYLDGNMDFTMLGYQYPDPPNSQVYFVNQANLTASFSGLEVTY